MNLLLAVYAFVAQPALPVMLAKLFTASKEYTQQMKLKFDRKGDVGAIHDN